MYNTNTWRQLRDNWCIRRTLCCVGEMKKIFSVPKGRFRAVVWQQHWDRTHFPLFFPSQHTTIFFFFHCERRLFWCWLRLLFGTTSTQYGLNDGCSAALQLYYYTASEERLQLQRPKVPSHFGNMAFLYNYKRVSVWHNLYAAQNKLLLSVYFSGRKKYRPG